MWEKKFKGNILRTAWDPLSASKLDSKAQAYLGFPHDLKLLLLLPWCILHWSGNRPASGLVPLVHLTTLIRLSCPEFQKWLPVRSNKQNTSLLKCATQTVTLRTTQMPRFQHHDQQECTTGAAHKTPHSMTGIPYTMLSCQPTNDQRI